MTTQLAPYLAFRGNAREAMEFYQSVLGGELTVSTFGEAGMSQVPAEQDLVLHAQVSSPTGLLLMGSDVPGSMPWAPPAGFSVSLSGEDEAELTDHWEKLSAEGTVTAPLARAPWGDTFGMYVDKFGITWLVNISPAGATAG